MRNWILLTMAMLWVGCGTGMAGAPRQERLQWDELQARVVNRKVAFVLPDGTNGEGKVIAVVADGLRLKVTKTSNRAVLRKGKQVVARQQLSVLHVTQYGWLWRFVGTVGAMGAASGIVAAQHIEIYEGYGVIIVPAVVAAGVAGAGVGGYYTGKKFDKQAIDIFIVP